MMRAGKKGAHGRMAVVVHGVEYESVKAAAEARGVSRMTAARRIEDPKNKDWRIVARAHGRKQKPKPDAEATPAIVGEPVPCEPQSEPPPTAAEWEVAAGNIGLVWHVVKGLDLSPDEADDAAQAGLFGLLRAARKFDPSLGYRFSTYAVGWVRQAVQKHMDADVLIRVPAYILHGKAKPEAFAEHADRASRVERIAMTSDDGDWTIDVAAPVDPEGPDVDELDQLRLAVAALPKREGEVIARRIGGATLKDVGRDMRLSTERIRQIETRAMVALKKAMAAYA